VAGPAGLVATLIDLGWVTPEQGIRFGKGGRIQPLGPQVTITQVRAEHSSEVTVTDPATKKSTTYPGGEPCGFIVQFENGFKLYHMGDTGLFGDMRLIGDYYRPDLIMVPIGGHFVMDPVDAAYATREMIKPKYAIPFHYGTFPVLKGTPAEYQQALAPGTTQVFPISPGDKLTFWDAAPSCPLPAGGGGTHHRGIRRMMRGTCKPGQPIDRWDGQAAGPIADLLVARIGG
jgi:L-ascorbate metabolism protein UlaG (beta-lactamase superfamily)